MPTNGHDHEEVVDLPPSALQEMITGGNNNNNNNNNQQLGLLESMFYAIFFNANWGYARIFPKFLRRVIEFVLLLKAVISFFVLVYVHMNFSRMPLTCLDHVKDVWPQNGVLRVEIIRNFQHSHAEQTGTINELLEKSYEREYKRKRMDMSEKNATWFSRFTKTNSLEKMGEVDIEQSTEVLVKNKAGETNTNLFNYLSFTNYFEVFNSDYIVEYSLMYEFLYLSPSARNRSNIPVMLVALDPTQCYADSVSQFFLDYFLGYDDLLLSSVKSLAENEQNKGFLRNVISEKFNRFDRMNTSRLSYIASFINMVIITLLISVILRIFQRQMFVSFLLVDLLNPLTFRRSMPLLVIFIALVGLMIIMSDTFNDKTTAFYVILIVCLADQYDTKFSCCPITKKHWPKFFYLYHLSFYAYHFRFNGKYSRLALISSWFFIQHSMVYFYHHYELQSVLQRDEWFQRFVQRAQHLRHRRSHQHQPTGDGSLRPEGRSPMEVTRNFRVMNGLNNLGRLRAVLWRRLRVRTFEPTPPSPPTTRQNTSPQPPGTPSS